MKETLFLSVPAGGLIPGRVLIRVLAFGLCATLASGCAHTAAKLRKSGGQLQEHSRALTTGVVDALQVTAPENLTPATELALKLAREDQRVEGLPLERIPVEVLLDNDTTGKGAQSEAAGSLGKRFAQIEKLLVRERKASERLLDLGEIHEAGQNRARLRGFKWLGSGTLVLAALLALAIFAPAALPIACRIIGWIVGKLPGLAGILGVVSVKAFDAVVKGIERFKGEPPGTSTIANDHSEFQSNAGFSTWELLHRHLGREMDASHKALVRARKLTLH